MEEKEEDWEELAVGCLVFLFAYLLGYLLISLSIYIYIYIFVCMSMGCESVWLNLGSCLLNHGNLAIFRHLLRSPGCFKSGISHTLGHIGSCLSSF